jgi:hypothetical protein
MLVFLRMRIAVFWVVTPHSDVVGYQLFGGPCHLHMHLALKMVAAWPSETSVSYYITTRSNNTENYNFNLHPPEELKSYIAVYILYNIYILEILTAPAFTSPPSSFQLLFSNC